MLRFHLSDMAPSFSFSLGFLDREVIGSKEWLQANTPLHGCLMASQGAFHLTSPGVVTTGHRQRILDEPGHRFLGDPWNFLETDWALSAAHSLEQCEHKWMAGWNSGPTPSLRLAVLKL